MSGELVACDGRLPMLYCRGKISIGRRFVVLGCIALRNWSHCIEFLSSNWRSGFYQTMGLALWRLVVRN